ncbi:hypothetical protein BEN78_06535 [Xanthomonas citri pv. mangiferaeindicae]|nr:hypothetical protein BEN78_06535 [Xanthomonas citri pv. mangiferaeindicae]
MAGWGVLRVSLRHDAPARWALCLIVGVLAGLTGGASGAAGAAEAPVMAPAAGTVAEAIGTAVMQEDGTLVLQLRAPLDGGTAHGETEIRYRPGTPEYAAVLAHLGGLTPGQSKPVPPWPEEE